MNGIMIINTHTDYRSMDNKGQMVDILLVTRQVFCKMSFTQVNILKREAFSSLLLTFFIHHSSDV